MTAMRSTYHPSLSAASSMAVALLTASLLSPATPAAAQGAAKTITGPAAFTDYSQEHPGVRRKITAADLPEPNQAEAVFNGPTVVAKPEGAWPLAPAGFKVELYAQDFRVPRLIRTAPNGDLFMADTGAGEIKV